MSIDRRASPRGPRTTNRGKRSGHQSSHKRGPSASGGNKGGASGAGSKGAAAPDDLYKTEMCHAYESTGACKYGFKCRFAHGEAELRPVARHPKYKTQHCKTFKEEGHCPYGARCKFIHDDSEDSSGVQPIPILERSRSELAPRTSSSDLPAANQRLHRSSGTIGQVIDPGAPLSASGSASHSSMSSSLSSPLDALSPFDGLSPRSPELTRVRAGPLATAAGTATSEIPSVPKTRSQGRLPIFQDIAGAKE